MAKVIKPLPPDHLTLQLFAPGMSLLHRAGLGGLACTLKAIERQYEAGLLKPENLPAEFNGNTPPWEITDHNVKLDFGRPEHTGEFLRKLFAFAFQIRDGLIYLPGQYPDPPPALAVRAEMQTALTRTFLQGAKKNIGLESSVTYTVDPDGCGVGVIDIEFQRCTWYLHQRLWEAFIDDDSGIILNAPKRKLDGNRNINFGSLFPGAIKRHDVFAESEASESISGLICLVFFLVGCSFARLSRSGDGVLLLPDVRDLVEFTMDRPQMTARTVSEIRVGGTADAAFLSEITLRSRCLLIGTSMPSLRAQRFSLRTWTKPQKSRVDAVNVMADDVSRVEPQAASREEQDLCRYERAFAFLPRGSRVRKDGSTFWIDSDLRPFIAGNLARGLKWYERFVEVANTPEKRNRLSYEGKGLSDMLNDNQMFDHDEESVIVRAVHGALRGLFAQIGPVYEDRPQLKQKKFKDEGEKWGRAFAGSMTLAQFRKTLTDMFRRGGSNPELETNWQQLLQMLRPDTWEHARDLALIGICSYPRTKSATSAYEGNAKPINTGDSE